MNLGKKSKKPVKKNKEIKLWDYQLNAIEKWSKI